MGVTAIKAILNRTDKMIEFRKREDSKDTISLDPDQGQVVNVDIPWCDNQKDFDTKAIEIKFLNTETTLYIWQSNGKVRYSFDGWNPNGSAVFGTAHEDGGRLLTIRKDLTPQCDLNTDS